MMKKTENNWIVIFAKEYSRSLFNFFARVCMRTGGWVYKVYTATKEGQRGGTFYMDGVL